MLAEMDLKVACRILVEQNGNVALMDKMTLSPCWTNRMSDTGPTIWLMLTHWNGWHWLNRVVNVGPTDKSKKPVLTQWNVWCWSSFGKVDLKVYEILLITMTQHWSKGMSGFRPYGMADTGPKEWLMLAKWNIWHWLSVMADFDPIEYLVLA